MRRLLVLLAACGHATSTPSSPRPDIADRFPLAKLDDRALCDQLLARHAEDYAIAVDAEPRTRRKVIVSDLHLGPGTSDPRFQGIEDFYSDAEWSAFLQREAAKGPTDLIINGDFIEFWQIATALHALPRPNDPKQPPKGAVLGADQAFAATAIDLVIQAHPAVFRGLGRFLDGGDNRVIIIAGNHDADLLWPKVQLAIARTIAPKDISRLRILEAVAYQHGGVYVAHGHEFDAANRFATQHAPFGRDQDGRCRLQTNWGEVFVDIFYTETERQLPFIDNLSPEQAGIIWGLRDNPDLGRDIGVAARAIELLRAAHGKGLNRDMAGAVLQGAFGVPGKTRGPESPKEVLDHTLDRLTNGDANAESLVAALADLATDPDLTNVRTGLVAAASSLPDPGATLKAIRTIEPEGLSRLQAKLFGDSMDTAARKLMHEHNLDIVILGHTHSVGGFVHRLDHDGKPGYYANTGSWISVASVADLRAQHISWDQLSLANRSMFPSKMTAITIDYDGTTPRPPAVNNAVP